MPDFWPLIRGSLPVLLGVGSFVAVVQLAAFVARRWRSNK